MKQKSRQIVSRSWTWVKKHKKLVLGAAGGGLVIAGLTVWLVFQAYNRPPGDGSRTVDFEVRPGVGSNWVTARLYKEKLIGSRTFFQFLLRLEGAAGKIKKGLYPLNDGMTPGKIIEVITSGRTKTVTVVIPPGYNNRQIGDRLVKAKLFESREEFLKLAGDGHNKIPADPQILKKYNIPAKTVEGYLFPETYVFPVRYPKKKVIYRMIDLFNEKTKNLKNMPTDPEKRHRMVILASIVEREAKLKEERPRIAGVFLNRLEKNYLLESCATVQYLFEKPKKRLFYHHLEIPSAFNTYLNKGLPPGPIASPGLHALKSTLNPEDTDYMFFVLKGNGAHYFSKSFAEHNKAKNKYIPKK